MDTSPRRSAPIFSSEALRRLIVPLIIEQFLAMAVGIADTVMVTGVGETAVSAVSLVDSLNNLLIQVFSALAGGGAVVVSQYLGNRENEQARISAKQLLYTTTFLASAIAAVSLLLRAPILRLIFGSVEDQIMYYSLRYFMLSALSYPFLGIYNSCAALFRSIGNSKASMWVSLLMNLLNICGNALLIYGFDLGVIGAGLASLISRAVAALVMLAMVHDSRHQFRLDHVLRVRLDFPIIRRILKIGVPNGLENGMFQIGRLMTQSLISSFGTASIAANAIINSVTSIVYVPGMAIGLAMVTVIGQCVGANEYDQAIKYGRKLMLMVYAGMISLNLVVLFGAPTMVKLFNLSAEAVAIAVPLMRINATCVCTLWPAAFTFPNILRAAGDARHTMIVSVLSMWIFRVGLSFVLAKYCDIGIRCVWYAMYVDWIVRAILFQLRYRSGKWKTKRVI